MKSFLLTLLASSAYVNGINIKSMIASNVDLECTQVYLGELRVSKSSLCVDIENQDGKGNV